MRQGQARQGRALSPAWGLILLLGLCLCRSPWAAEASAPRALTLVSGYAPGGLSDRLARLTARHLAQALNKPVVVKNLPGAAGLRAALEIAHTSADAPTLFLADSSLLWTYEAHPPAEDGLSQFQTIGTLGQTPLALVVRSASGVRSPQDLVASLRADPQVANFGSPGQRSLHHGLGQAFVQMAGVKATHIPYPGGLALLPDLYEGRLSFAIVSVPLAAEQALSGRLRIVAVSGLGPSAKAPQAPALLESFPTLSAVTTAYLLAAPASPASALAVWRSAWETLRHQPDFLQAIHQMGLEPEALDAPAAQRLLQQERSQFRRMLQAAPAP